MDISFLLQNIEAVGLVGVVVFVVGLLTVFFRKKSSDTPVVPADKVRPEELVEAKEVPPVTPQEHIADAKPRDAAPVAPAGPAPLDWNASKSVNEALANTEKSFWGRIKGLFGGTGTTPEIEGIEEILYTSDLGPKTVTSVMESLEELSGSDRKDFGKVKSTLRDSLGSIFSKVSSDEETFHALNGETPQVYMVVGVNGAGKTTSIGKLSAHFARLNKKVMVIAGDTFRAAAGSQLKVWTERAGVEVFSPEGITDPSAVVFDGLTKAKAAGYDVVVVDTAGRLHTSAPLMEELKKMKRVMQKVIPAAPHQAVIVLDANSGQNALMQAKEFHAALGLTGVILTKLDGTAKGGVAFGIVHELGVPIRWIGIGEKLGDLKPFSSREFVDSILPP